MYWRSVNLKLLKASYRTSHQSAFVFTGKTNRYQSHPSITSMINFAGRWSVGLRLRVQLAEQL